MKIINDRLTDENGELITYEGVEIIPDSVITPAEYTYFKRPSLRETLKWRIYYWWYKERHIDDIIRKMNEIWKHAQAQDGPFIVVADEQLAEILRGEDASWGEDTQNDTEAAYPKSEND